jgi:curved DNA-binding protein CbpA
MSTGVQSQKNSQGLSQQGQSGSKQMEQIPKSGSLQEKDYYQILGLSEKSSQQDIENAYSKLSVEWHPERHTSDRVQAQQRFNDISEAYHVLSDSARRVNYDQRRLQRFSI